VEAGLDRGGRVDARQRRRADLFLPPGPRGESAAADRERVLRRGRAGALGEHEAAGRPRDIAGNPERESHRARAVDRRPIDRDAADRRPVDHGTVDRGASDPGAVNGRAARRRTDNGHAIAGCAINRRATSFRADCRAGRETGSDRHAAAGGVARAVVTRAQRRVRPETRRSASAAPAVRPAPQSAPPANGNPPTANRATPTEPRAVAPERPSVAAVEPTAPPSARADRRAARRGTIEPLPPASAAASPSAGGPTASAGGAATGDRARLKLEVVSYSDTPAQRLVFISGRKYVEGDTTEGGFRIEQIKEDSVILSDAGGRFTLR
jgi:hypothetical protein